LKEKIASLEKDLSTSQNQNGDLEEQVKKSKSETSATNKKLEELKAKNKERV